MWGFDVLLVTHNPLGRKNGYRRKSKEDERSVCERQLGTEGGEEGE